ncbi:MAG: hypothetical protein V2G41_09710 [bacterium JZ-2024 1]
MAIFDAHIGYEAVYDGNKWRMTHAHDERLLNRIIKFARSFEPEIVILGGDQLNMDSISRFRSRSRVFKLDALLAREYEMVDDSLLKPLEGIAKTIVWLDGNHEDRVRKVVEENPQYIGLIDYHAFLEFDKRNIKRIRPGGSFRLGGLLFVHGDHIPTAQNLARSALNRYPLHVRFGHYHTYQAAISYSTDRPRTAIAVPASCKRNLSYMNGRPNDWIGGFLWGEVSKSGAHRDYVEIISYGRMDPELSIHKRNRNICKKI